MNRLVLLSLAVVSLATTSASNPGPLDVFGQDGAKDASKIAEAWWYVGDGKSRANEGGSGPKDGSFFAYTGTLTNLGSYESAWNFYAEKCGAKERFSETLRIIGRPSDTEGYFTIFQRADGARNTTTFASHEKDSTVTVYLHEIESSPDKTVLQVSVVVARR